MTILAVGAHPDDLEWQCGGTLAKYVKARHKVYMCHAANGDKGHFTIHSEELSRLRREEARAAAAIIGAESLTLDYPDASILPSQEAQDRFVDLVRQTRPDVIITHSPDDYMSDHVNVSKLVCDASFYAAAPHYKTQVKEPHEGIPPVYFMDAMMGVGFLPQDYVDITDEFEIKCRALACHQSQVTWMREHDHLDVLECLEVSARYRGMQCGVRYAEAFRRCNLWPRLSPGRLIP
jgi:LmbE family N-acetylglucosaminyl deacetylase